MMTTAIDIRPTPQRPHRYDARLPRFEVHPLREDLRLAGAPEEPASVHETCNEAAAACGRDAGNFGAAIFDRQKGRWDLGAGWAATLEAAIAEAAR